MTAVILFSAYIAVGLLLGFFAAVLMQRANLRDCPSGPYAPETGHDLRPFPCVALLAYCVAILWPIAVVLGAVAGIFYATEVGALCIAQTLHKEPKS